MRTLSIRTIGALSLLIASSAGTATSQMAGPRYDGPETRAVVEALVEAHGGIPAFEQIESLDYWFFTKASGNPQPFLSHETIDPATGRAILEWPVLDAITAYTGDAVWSTNWNAPFPPGFFAHLTYGFLTLPWQTQNPGFSLALDAPDRLPNDETEYTTVRLTPAGPTSLLPGTYYRLFIDPETNLLKAIEFDIAHPGMVANPTQPLGPNFHVFADYREFDGIVLPAFYESYGFNNRSKESSNAIHYVFGLTTDQAFDESRLEQPGDAKIDEVSAEYWGLE